MIKLCCTALTALLLFPATIQRHDAPISVLRILNSVHAPALKSGRAVSSADELPPRHFHAREKRTVHRDSQESTLRGYASQIGLYFGSMVDDGPHNGWDSQWLRDTLSSQFNMIEPGNQFKWALIHPEKDRFDFSRADAFVRFAYAHNMKVRGHNLLWGMANPPWLGNGPARTYSKFTSAELEDLLVNHIRTVVGHYREQFPGIVRWWDVTNELMGWNNLFNTDGILWSKIGNSADKADYVRAAFRAARWADPSAILCMNDWGNEGGNPLRTRNMVAAVAKFRAEGVPIDCVGMEMHLDLKDPPTYAQVVKTMAAYADLGVEVQVTEFDIQGTRNAEDWPAAAKLAAAMLKACLHSPNCTLFNSWGFSQRYYLNDANRPDKVTMLPWDAEDVQTPVYFAIISTMKEFIERQQ